MIFKSVWNSFDSKKWHLFEYVLSSQFGDNLLQAIKTSVQIPLSKRFSRHLRILFKNQALKFHELQDFVI